MKPLRPIVSVNIDGSIHGFFESRTQAEELNKICHKDMGRALKNHYYTCRGFKWYYEDEYREGWFNYGEEYFAWQPSSTHKRRGSGFKQGHTLGNGYNYWSEESKQRKRESSRKVCLKRKETGSYAIMGLKLRKPIVCTTDGLQFDAIKTAASHYGIHPNYISLAIKRGGSTKGLRFKFI